MYYIQLSMSSVSSHLNKQFSIFLGTELFILLKITGDPKDLMFIWIIYKSRFTVLEVKTEKLENINSFKINNKPITLLYLMKNNYIFQNKK